MLFKKIAHFLFNKKSTTGFENRDQILQVLEKHGAINDCQAGR
jgi:hypothetical protein